MPATDETTPDGHRHSRNEGFFGADGQTQIAATPVAIVGLGGLGSHVAQQLGYLGTQSFLLIDHDDVTESSMNRVVTADDGDAAAGTLKVDAAKRRLLAINPAARVTSVPVRLNDEAAFEAIAEARVVFGCVDNDFARVQLTRICSELAIPLIDLATDVDVKANPMTFGGRVVCCTGDGCLVCLGVLDQHSLALANMTDEQAQAYERIYGISRDALGQTGPMVVSINGTVASLAVTEFIVLVTGLRPVTRELSYLGHRGVIVKSGDQPPAGCWYCAGVWGRTAPFERAESA
jgi:molybdopterin-synthase adenylyltransferase